MCKRRIWLIEHHLDIDVHSKETMHWPYQWRPGYCLPLCLHRNAIKILEPREWSKAENPPEIGDLCLQSLKEAPAHQSPTF